MFEQDLVSQMEDGDGITGNRLLARRTRVLRFEDVVYDWGLDCK